MSGLVSRRSVRSGQLLTVLGVVGGVAAITVLAAVWLWPGAPADAPLDVMHNPVQVTRARRAPQPEELPVVAQVAPPQQPVVQRREERPVQNYESQAQETGPLTTEFAGDPPRQQMAALEPTGPAGGGGHRVGEVSFKQFRLEGAEAGVVTDLSRTIKPTTRAILVLDQALDSSLPGPLVAHFDQDVLAWDNHWPPLIPKGTPVLGEYQSLTVGQGRMAAISAGAYLSDGRIVPLGAPFQDDLGRTGIPGHVDTRWMERIGNALIADAAFALIRLPEAALNSRQPGTTNLNLNLGSTENAVSQILNSTLNLLPILRKNQGERVMILITQPIRVPDIRLEVRR